MSLGTHETSGRTGEKIAWDCRSAFRVVELRFANKEGNWLGAACSGHISLEAFALSAFQLGHCMFMVLP